jgi:DNA invertase Pin-like site-specific DNA recombinase
MYIIPQFQADEILVYLRKSRADDAVLTVEEVLENHERRINTWLENNMPDAYPLPQEAFFREVVSGETLESRPRAQELLRKVESPKVKAVICTEPSRLSRGSLREIGYLVDILRFSNTIVITLDRGAYDLNDDRDRKDFERELMGSNEYLEYQKRIQQNGKHTAVTQFGCFIGSQAPYGYKKVDIRRGKKKLHTLEAIPEQAEVVKRIFEMYVEGLGTVRIADILTEERVPTANGKKQWIHGTITRMLQNEHYLGKVVWYRNKQTKTVEDGQIVVKRPRSNKKIVAEGLHDAIISQELWDAAQKARGKKPRVPKSNELVNPLAGLLFCKDCRSAMSYRSNRDLNGRQKAAPSYKCSYRRDGCTCGSAPHSEVMDEVVSALRAELAEFEVRAEGGKDNSLELHRKKIEHLEKRLEDLHETEAKQWAEKMKNGMPEHVFKRLNKETVEEIAEVQQTLYEARENMPEAVDMEEIIVTLKSTLDALQDPDAPVKEQNRLLKACFARIDFYREQAPRQGGRHLKDARPLTLEFTLRF